jgi:murein DD-endopeptidase MepM/ murein hydrolase activator NlpD
MVPKRFTFARPVIHIAGFLGAGVLGLALAGPAAADSRVVSDRADTAGPLDIRYAGHGHVDADTVTATVTTWEAFRLSTLTGPNMIAVAFYRGGFPYRWVYVSRRAGGLRAIVKGDNGDVIGSASASRPNRRTVSVRILEGLLGDPAGYRWVAFTAFRSAGTCAGTCTDAVRSFRAFVKTGVLSVRPTLHDLTAPSIRLLRFPDPSTRQSATLRYRVRFAVRDTGGAGLRFWRLDRRLAGETRWVAVANGSRRGRKEISLRGGEGAVYQHRVVAADWQGNRRASRVARVSVPLDDANTSLAQSYQGDWEPDSATSSDFRATLHSSSDVVARFVYKFTGTSVAWIGPASDGSATVAVDGAAPTEVDLTSFTGRRAVLFETAFAPGGHTISIRPVRGSVAVDGLVIRNDVSPTPVANSTTMAKSSFVPTTIETSVLRGDDGLECTLGDRTDELCAAALQRSPLTRTYADSWRGWPVRPLHGQHPVRGSFLDPRPGGFHFGIDISVRDDRRERGAPRGRTHRVYAIEGGMVYNVVDGTSPCVLRRLWAGHFAYYHVDATVVSGQHVRAGQMIGWTCRGQWHVHLSEFRGGKVLVNPLRRGGKLSPYNDTEEPVIKRFGFFRVAPPLWTNPGGWMWSPTTGTPLSPDGLSGVVDVRVWMSDPQSFRGWLTALPTLYADLHPSRAVLIVVRLRDDVRVLRRELFNNFFPYALPLNNHFAPGTRATRRAQFCFRRRRRLPVPCGGRYWLHGFGTPGGAYWNTRGFADGLYQIRVTAWDPLHHATTRGVKVRVKNS